MTTTRPGSHTVVAVDPLFDDGPDAMIDLARRFGRYQTSTWADSSRR